jgi:enamine deaminase RidA (YjgF/YER057c/UK114 family)
VGAGGGAHAVAAQLAFLSHSGPGALAGLVGALEERGLSVRDLLRVRAFVTTGARAGTFLGELERILPRPEWPALTVVQVPAGGRTEALDAIAAPRACGRVEAEALDAITAPQACGRRVEAEVLGAIAAPQACGRRVVADGTVRLGDWVFVGAVGGEGERIELQARSVFERMRASLAAAGARLDDVVKVGGWLTFPMADYAPLARVRGELVKDGLLPASSAVQVSMIHPVATAGHADASGTEARPSQIALDPEGHRPLLSFEAIAFTGGEGRGSGRVSPLAPYYATARSAGGYVFTCGEIPRRRAPVEAQLRDVYGQLDDHLKEHGATLGGTLAQTLYVRSGHDQQATAREAAVSEAAALLAPAPARTTVLSVTDLGFRQGVDVEVELIAQTGA